MVIWKESQHHQCSQKRQVYLKSHITACLLENLKQKTYPTNCCQGNELFDILIVKL
jgi:hypothetical protein